MMIDAMPCPFCGQMLMLLEPISEDASSTEKNEAAANRCNCNEAQQVRHAMEQVAVGEFNVEQLLEGYPEVVKIVRPAVKLIRYGKIKKLVVQYESGEEEIKVSMSLDGNCNVKASKTITIKEVRT